MATTSVWSIASLRFAAWEPGTTTLPLGIAVTAALESPGESVTDHVCAVLHAQLTGIDGTHRLSMCLTPVGPRSVRIGPVRAERLADLVEDLKLALAGLDHALAAWRTNNPRRHSPPLAETSPETTH